MARRGARWSGLVALFAAVSRRGVTNVIALSLAAACVVTFWAFAIILAAGRHPDSLPGVPLLASSALAFAAGVLIAFSSSTGSLRGPFGDGVAALLRARGVRAELQVLARVAGLTRTLAWTVGGGSAAVGIVATLLARTRPLVVHTAQASLAAVLFGLAFAFLFAPVAMATLAHRGRIAGYAALLAVLVLPELLPEALRGHVPERWLAVASIRGALVSLRTALAPPYVDPWMLGRALAATVAIAVIALAFLQAESARRRRAR